MQIGRYALWTPEAKYVRICIAGMESGFLTLAAGKQEKPDFLFFCRTGMKTEGRYGQNEKNNTCDSAAGTYGAAQDGAAF